MTILNVPTPSHLSPLFGQVGSRPEDFCSSSNLFRAGLRGKEERLRAKVHLHNLPWLRASERRSAAGRAPPGWRHEVRRPRLAFPAPVSVVVKPNLFSTVSKGGSTFTLLVCTGRQVRPGMLVNTRVRPVNTVGADDTSSSISGQLAPACLLSRTGVWTRHTRDWGAAGCRARGRSGRQALSQLGQGHAGSASVQPG